MPHTHQRRIRKLSPLIISQISAGEVIDRPASVVKELVENAIDAGATRIVVQAWQGGMNRIDVTDNGKGIVEDDLALSVMRHTTSKLTNDDVLGGVDTLGFRGEALASIGAVARLKLASSAENTGIGYELSVEGDSVTSDLLTDTAQNTQDNDRVDTKITLKPVAMPQGTHASVQALFFNVPARRRFLKSIATEFGHIESIIRRLALNYFDISFELWHDEQLRLSVNAIDASQTFHPSSERSDGQHLPNAIKKRLTVLLDGTFANSAQAISVSMAQNTLQFGEQSSLQGELTGWLNASIADKHQKNKQSKVNKSAKHQYWFVNGRLVQNRALRQLVQQSVEQAIGQYCSQPHLFNHNASNSENSLSMVDEQLCVATLGNMLLDYVLFLTVPEETVNVNIHPTKLDVRLENEQQLISVLSYYLQKHLRSMLDANAPSALADAQAQQQNKFSNYGQALYWNSQQLLSQTDEGFLLINAQKGLGIATNKEASDLLHTWQTFGKPTDVVVKSVSFDKLVSLIQTLDE